MRLFAALIPPERVLEDLDEFLEVRREVGPFRWTQADQVHVTLAFLADAPERSLDELVERLGRAAGRRTPFVTAVAGGGAFPHAARARVLWTGLHPDEAGRAQLRPPAARAPAAAPSPMPPGRGCCGPASTSTRRAGPSSAASRPAPARRRRRAASRSTASASGPI